MESIKLGIIGVGNMADAILESVFMNEIFKPGDITLFDTDSKKLQKVEYHGVAFARSNSEVVKNSDIVILAVKPQSFDAVLKEIEPVSQGKCFVSIAAGISTKYVKDHLGPCAYVLRIMPNAPILYGLGATAIAKTDNVPHEFYQKAISIFAGAGEVAFVDEDKLNEITAVNASSPAYFFLMIDAMVKCAVEQGIEPAVALRLASKAMEGSAVMLLKSGRTPAELAAQITSAGGTTLAALSALEEKGFTDSVREGMLACTRRAYEIGK